MDNCELEERVWGTDYGGNNKTNDGACYGTQNNIEGNKPPAK